MSCKENSSATTKPARSISTHLRAPQIVRNSDPDAALYWLARMLESGEDPLYLARRMVRMASEDIARRTRRSRRHLPAGRFDFLVHPKASASRRPPSISRSRQNPTPLHRLRFRDGRRPQNEADPVSLTSATLYRLMKNIGYGEATSTPTISMIKSPT